MHARDLLLFFILSCLLVHVVNAATKNVISTAVTDKKAIILLGKSLTQETLQAFMAGQLSEINADTKVLYRDSFEQSNTLFSDVLTKALQEQCQYLRQANYTDATKYVEQLNTLLAMFTGCRSHLYWRNQLEIIPELLRSYAFVHYTHMAGKDKESYHLKLQSVLDVIGAPSIQKRDNHILKDFEKRASANIPGLLRYQCVHDTVKYLYATASTLGLARFYHELLYNDQRKHVVKIIEQYPWIIEKLFDYIAAPMLEQGGKVDKNPRTVLEEQERNGKRIHKLHKKERYSHMKSAKNTIAILWGDARTRKDQDAKNMWWKSMQRLIHNQREVETIASRSTKLDPPQSTEDRYKKICKKKKDVRLGKS